MQIHLIGYATNYNTGRNALRVLLTALATSVNVVAWTSINAVTTVNAPKWRLIP